MTAPKKHIVYLTEEEIISLANTARVCIKMADEQSSPYLSTLKASAETGLEKLKAKLKEIRE